MRILFCNKYNFRFSGTEAYLFELCQMLREQGHSVALFSMRDPRGEPSEYDRFFVRHIDFKHPNLGPLEKMRLAAHAVYSLETRRQLSRVIQRFHPDIAHVRNIYHHLSPSLFWELRKHNVPVVYHLNDFKVLCPNYNLFASDKPCERCRGGQFWRAITTGCYAGGRCAATVLAGEAYIHKWLHTYQRCVDLFLAPSAFVRDKFVEHGWPAATISVLPHFQRISAEVRPAPAGAPIVYFGRLSREKGLSDLLLAIRSLPHIPLIIAGDGPQRAELENLCTSLELKCVTFTGHLEVDELKRLIAESCFSVMPSRAYETLGKNILESYGCGRAVIATDVGSRREFVQQGKTGLLVPPGDVAGLAEAISFLYDHRDRASQMGKAAREYVRQRHSPEGHCAALLGLYEGLASRKAALRVRSLPTLLPPRPLRVAFIGGRGVISKYSGIEAYYEEVGKRLAQAGHQVVIYCRNWFTPALASYEGMELIRLAAWRSKHLETLTHTLLSTLHVLAHRCDVVHYHALGPALFSFLPRLAGMKTVVTVQGLDWQRKKWGRIAAQVLQFGEIAAVRFPNETMVVSRTLQQYYRRKYGADTVYIPNGTLIRQRRPAAIIRAWDLEADNYVLFLGRFSPEKNCHLLIDAFERIDTSVKLVLAGGFHHAGPYAETLLQHRSERILLLEYVAGNALEELLTNSMLFVLPSDLEGMSLALLEAMGAGLCVLVSDIPENVELVDGAGFTFRRGDVADLERMLRLLLADESLRKAAGIRARQRIQTYYLWPGITRQIEGVYRRAVGQALGAEVPPTTDAEPVPAPGHRAA